MNKLFLSLIGLLFLSTGCNRDPSFVRGDAFSLHFPPGWTRLEKKIEPDFKMDSKFPVQTVTFASPQVNPDTNMPEAMITMHVVRPFEPFWLEDDFPRILEVLSRSGFGIMDKGQIKLDEEIANWVVYRDDYQGRIRLEFFTVNGSGIVFRLQYSAQQEKFAAHRKAFEDTRVTVKLRKW